MEHGGGLFNYAGLVGITTKNGKNTITLNQLDPYYLPNEKDKVFLNEKYSLYYIRDQFVNALGFNTGGYTGSWGPEGKMAMLHQKEIVLNETDTANFLESIKLLRSILNFIDLQATNAQFSSLLSSSRFTPSTSEVLEQNVHIDAHFDNVTDRNEIVEAFNTLVNRASQYANRKK